MHGLVIFDVDGTLSHTSRVDDDCWVDAACAVLGIDSMSTDWSDYSHSTDEAIASDLIRDRTTLPQTRETVHRIRDAFIDRIRQALATDAGLFRPVPGSPEVFARLRDAGWASAIATGGWRTTACLKLDAAGVPHETVPAAHADDAHPRESIVTIAAERAERHHDRTFERLVYVGDGVWDVRAAGRLGIGFVGIAEGDRAERLRAEGATIVLPGFADVEEFLAAVSTTAAGPRRSIA
jgi:phosphoglycolate phosphatase-like HAD superfamily hydrolase